MTEWFYEDEVCWVAECEACCVPMVVWKQHDPAPPDEVRVVLHARLAAVMAEHFVEDYRVDDHLRTIPDHYHAHARRWGGFTRR
jgi:spore maturation protein CgeB